MNNELAMSSIREEARVLARMTGKGRGVILEDLLSRLRQLDPLAAELFGNLLTATAQVPSDLRTSVGRELAKQARAVSDSAGDPRSAVDLLVIAPKPIEEDAVIAAFQINRETGVTTSRLRLNGVSGSVGKYTVVICSPKQDGNVNMALYASEWLNDWRPKLAVLVGMAGGRHAWVTPGDVVLGEGIYDYQVVRRVATPDGGVEDRNRFLPYPVPVDIIRDMRNLATPEWRTRMKSDCLGAMKGLPADRRLTRAQVSAWVPDLKPGGVLAGSTLIENNSIEELAASIHDRANSVEMEGAGFAAVMQERRVPWLTLRGIADMGGHPDYADADGKTRTKIWQFAATFAAAHYLKTALPVINEINDKRTY